MDLQRLQPVARRFGFPHQREGQVPGAIDNDRNDAGFRLHGDPRHRAVESQRLSVRLHRVRQVDREAPAPLEVADQPPRNEHMLGLEGDGARQCPIGLHPSGPCAPGVEDVQRVGGQRRQHDRRIDARLVEHGIDDRRGFLCRCAECGVIKAPDQFEGDQPERLRQRVAPAKPLGKHGRQVGGRHEG